MIEHLFLPPGQQFDSGFGETAHGFHQAAKQLDGKDANEGYGMSQSRLPVYFLYRHAVELYLKGIILTLYRRFSDEYPALLSNAFPDIERSPGHFRKLYNIHTLGILYRHLLASFEKHEDDIRKNTASDWSLPQELSQWVAIIAEADAESTMFRYPVTQNADFDIRKAPFRATDPANIKQLLEKQAPGGFTLLFKNDEGAIEEAYRLDHTPMLELHAALSNCCEVLSGFSLGLIAELVYGVNPNDFAR